MFDKTKQVISDVVTAPAVPLSLGNVFLASQTAEPLGILLNSATCLATTGLQAYQSLTNKQVGLPFWLLSAVNAASVGSVLYEGAEQVGLEQLLEFHGEASKYLLSAGAFASWSAGHALAGIHQAKGTEKKGVLNNEQTWYGVGDLAAVQGNPTSSVFFAIGLANALRTDLSEKPDDSASAVDYLRWHATPARFYGMGYILGAMLTLNDPAFAAAQASWGVGYLNFDADQNKALLQDVKTVVHSGFNYLCTQAVKLRLLGKPTFTLESDQEPIDLKSLLLHSFGVIDTLRLGLGMPRAQLWDTSADTATRIYLGLPEEKKQKAFSLLEFLATKTQVARSAISEMADRGDPLSVTKMERIGRLAATGVALGHPNRAEIEDARSMFRGMKFNTDELR